MSNTWMYRSQWRKLAAVYKPVFLLQVTQKSVSGTTMAPHTSAFSQTRPLPLHILQPTITWPGIDSREGKKSRCMSWHKLHNLKHLQHIIIDTYTDRHLQPPSSVDPLFDQPQLFWIFCSHCVRAVQLLCSSISRPCSPTHKRHHTYARSCPRPHLKLSELWLHDRSLQACREVRSSLGPSLSRPQSLPK